MWPQLEFQAELDGIFELISISGLSSQTQFCEKEKSKILFGNYESIFGR